jgi:hypothetical protein
MHGHASIVNPKPIYAQKFHQHICKKCKFRQRAARAPLARGHTPSAHTASPKAARRTRRDRSDSSNVSDPTASRFNASTLQRFNVLSISTSQYFKIHAATLTTKPPPDVSWGNLSQQTRRPNVSWGNVSHQIVKKIVGFSLRRTIRGKFAG